MNNLQGIPRPIVGLVDPVRSNLLSDCRPWGLSHTFPKSIFPPAMWEK